MTEESNREKSLVRVKYKDILVIPLECIPEIFCEDSVTSTLNNYLEYVNATGVMPLRKEGPNPYVLGFNSEWLNRGKV